METQASARARENARISGRVFRLYDREADPPPVYKTTIEAAEASGIAIPATADENEPDAIDAGREFAFERDLQNYLVKNLSLIESGLRLYEDEGISGVEFPVGGRYIDILAVDRSGGYVVMELKVSKGYDRVVGQLLRYMGWVEKNLEPKGPVRGVIVANEITDDLKLACSRLEGVRLIEYEISFKLLPV